MKKIFLTTILAVLSAVATLAHDFEKDGIYYKITSSSSPYTAAVSYRGSSYSSYYNEYSGSVVIPSSVSYDGTTYSVTSIGSDAFDGCSSLTSITIPNSVTSIGSGAFLHCSNLTSVTIPNSVASIGQNAFDGCSSLTSIEIPNSVTSIGYQAFSNCSSLTKVQVSDIVAWCNIKFWGEYNNGDYNWQEFANPLYYAKHLYLNGKEVTNLVIPEGVTKINDYAFYNCEGLTSVTIPSSVTSIGQNAFYGCSGLTSITIPNSVTRIERRAFSGSGLTSVTIPNSVTSIADSTFYGCSGLTSITIGESVKNIGEKAFYGLNDNCTSIICKSKVPPTCSTPATTFGKEGSTDLTYLYTMCTLYVPMGQSDIYKEIAPWSNFKKIVELDMSLETSEITKVEAGKVTVSANGNDADFSWPKTASASAYSLEIKKDGKVFCTLDFNEYGQLTGLNLKAMVEGFKFKVTGLKENSSYSYTMQAKSASGSVLKSYTGSFKTGTATAVEDVATEAFSAYAAGGTVYCSAEEFQIFNVQGKNVTNQNGALPAGVYVVVAKEGRGKVVVK